MIHQDTEWPIGKVHGGLPQDLVQDGAVGFCREGREKLRLLEKGKAEVKKRGSITSISIKCVS